MKTTYAKVNAYNGEGEYRIIRDEDKKDNQFSLVCCFYDTACCGYGLARKQKTLGRYADLKSALRALAETI